MQFAKLCKEDLRCKLEQAATTACLPAACQPADKRAAMGHCDKNIANHRMPNWDRYTSMTVITTTKHFITFDYQPPTRRGVG